MNVSKIFVTKQRGSTLLCNEIICYDDDAKKDGDREYGAIVESKTTKLVSDDEEFCCWRGVQVVDLMGFNCYLTSSQWDSSSHYRNKFRYDVSENKPNQTRSEEHTSELQSHSDLVCRLLLEKKKHTKRKNKKRT